MIPKFLDTEKKKIFKLDDVKQKLLRANIAKEHFKEEVKSIESIPQSEINEALEIRRKLNQLSRYEKLQSKKDAVKIQEEKCKEIKDFISDMEKKGINEVQFDG